MKKIYLTFDIETIVSGISRNKNYLAGVYLASMFIAEELRKRELKGTFFISLSSKQDQIDQKKYLEFIKWLIFSLKPYKNIKIEPHIHAYRLPVSFKCSSDEFSKYDLSQQEELLTYAKDFFKKEGVDISSFRPGGFNSNDSYYSALNNSDYKYSSLLIKNINVNIDLVNKKINQGNIILKDNGIYEYPVTSVRVKSIKGGIEILNLSPDFFKLSSVEKYMEELNYININFHSFSIYLNRLIRENHDNIILKNLNFLLFENILNKLLKYTSIQTLNSDTVVSNELINWLDYIKKNNYKTYFIGE